MTRNVTRIASSLARLGLAGGLALAAAMPAHASARPDQPVRSWSAMTGVSVADLLRQAETLPLSDTPAGMAAGDQPYCAADTEIRQTLDQDFAESPVTGAAEGPAQLWGSDLMGTWTLVAARADDTSCIVASGIGYDAGRDAAEYFSSAGLR